MHILQFFLLLKRIYIRQVAWSLRQDERVVNMERTNIRYISSEQIPEPIDMAVMDLSFISIKLVLPAVCSLLKDGGDLM